MFFIIVDGGNHIIIFPAPEFVPGERVPDHGAMPLICEVRIYIFVIFGFQADPLHHTFYRPGFGQLGILYRKGKLVGNNFPAHFTIEGNRVGIQE